MERSVREKDLRRSTEKESLKGSRKDRLLERARKNDTRRVERKESLQGSRSGKLSRKIAACDPQSLP